MINRKRWRNVKCESTGPSIDITRTPNNIIKFVKREYTRQRSESMKYYDPKKRNETLLLLANESSQEYVNAHQRNASKYYREKCHKRGKGRTITR